jgi:hypothetical protein
MWEEYIKWTSEKDNVNMLTGLNWLRKDTNKCRTAVMLMKKMTALWDIVPYSLVEVDRRFRDVYCLHHQGDEYAACGNENLKSHSVDE